MTLIELEMVHRSDKDTLPIVKKEPTGSQVIGTT